MLALCQYDLHAFDLNEEEKQKVFYTSQLTNINKDSEDLLVSLGFFTTDGRLTRSAEQYTSMIMH